MLQNNRRHQRVKVSIPARVEYVAHGGKRTPFKGSLVDVSMSGMSVMIATEFWGTVGNRSMVKIGMVIKREKVQKLGYVVRNIKNSDETRTLGIEFQQPSFSILTGVKDMKDLWFELHEA